DTPTVTNTPTVTDTPSITPTPTSTATATNTPQTNTCNFNETIDNSDLDLRVTGNSSLGGLVGNVSGAINVACSPTGGSGKRTCTCDLQSWTPANITGIGFVCIFPASGCAAGEVDCDGG